MLGILTMNNLSITKLSGFSSRIYVTVKIQTTKDMLKCMKICDLIIYIIAYSLLNFMFSFMIAIKIN